jgi:hypothetical protein
MADYSTHNDDVALLMIHRKPDKAASGSLDSSGPADAGTADKRDIRWSGQHAIVTMPAEMDLANSSDVSDLLAAAARPSTASRSCACACAGVGFGVTLVLGGIPAGRALRLWC